MYPNMRIPFLVTYVLTVNIVSTYKLPIYYHDARNWEVLNGDQVDLDFDIAVAIGLYERTGRTPSYDTYATGVMIDTKRVLTSFNPFRSISNRSELLPKVKLSFLTGRDTNILTGFPKATQTWHDQHIRCARQISPVMPEDILRQNYTGSSDNNPLHDLMVMRLKSWRVDTIFANARGLGKLDAGWWPKNYKGPRKMRFKIPRLPIANSKDRTGGQIKIGTLENRYFYLIKHPITHRRMNVIKLPPGDIVDCQLFFPREWGYFICVRNRARVLGIHSGAILLMKNKVFGIGSFTLIKGLESIFAFTDVRKYTKQMQLVCSPEERGSPDEDDVIAEVKKKQAKNATE